MHQVQSLDLVLLQQYWKGPFEDVNPPLQVDDVQHVVNCFLKVLPFRLFFPLWLTVEELQEFVANLLDKISET